VPITLTDRLDELPPITTELKPWPRHEVWNTQREHIFNNYRLFNWVNTSPTGSFVNEQYPDAFDDKWRRLAYFVARVNKSSAVNDGIVNFLLVTEDFPGVTIQLWSRMFRSTATTGGPAELQGAEWVPKDTFFTLPPVGASQNIIMPPRSILQLNVFNAIGEIDGILYEANNLSDLLNYA